MASESPRPSEEGVPSVPKASTPVPEAARATTPAPVVASASAVPVTPFEQAIKAWSEIGLSNLQRGMDDTGVEILENQKASVLTRKELATRTKAFRKVDDETKLGEIKGLLKLYQTEIDNLTNRSKYAETSFMNVYKLLAEAPDPMPLLEASVDSVSAASEVSKLADENAALVNKLARYADYENIKQKLMQTELKAIETSKAKVSAKEAEMKAIIDEKERHWAMKEAELSKQVQDARNQVKDLRANNEVMQARLSAQSGDQLAGSIGDASAAQAAGRIAELELVASDLERANRRTLEVEKRNVELRTELEAAKSGSQETAVVEKLEGQISDLQQENVMLAAQLDSVRTSASQAKKSTQTELEALQRDLARKAADAEALKTKLNKMQDYTEIKKELEILKAVEFAYNDNDDDEDDDDDEEEHEESKNIESNTESLEKLMLARNKKLSNDMTLLRISNNKLTEEVATLQKQVHTKTAELEKALHLNHKLEEDLLKSNHSSSLRGSNHAAMSVVSGWNHHRPGTVRSGRISPTASILGGDSGSSGQQSPSALSVPSADTSILPIITQQRDRFKARNTELEEELRKNWATINGLRKEIEAVKNDNVELYEKARYASSYRGGANSGTNTAFRGIGGSGNDTEDRYKNVYEAGLSPFQQFKGLESQRAYSKMGPFERIVYSFTRFILVNRLSRNLFLVYCVGLHLLVTVVLIAGTSSLVPGPEHMAGASGVGVGIGGAVPAAAGAASTEYVVHGVEDVIPDLAEGVAADAPVGI